MTPQEIINDFSDLIQDMASYAYYKVPKPTILSIEDFYQEGCLRAIVAMQRWYDPSKGTSVRTYIYQAVCSKFMDLIDKSCRHLNNKPMEIEEDGEMFTPSYIPDSPIPSPIDILLMEERYNTLTQLEREYIKLWLDKPTTNTISHTALIRKQLGLTYKDEKRVKQSIFEKMLS